MLHCYIPVPVPYAWVRNDQSLHQDQVQITEKTDKRMQLDKDPKKMQLRVMGIMHTVNQLNHESSLLFRSNEKRKKRISQVHVVVAGVYIF